MPASSKVGLRSNVVSNLFSSGWSAALNLACVPVYMRLLGMEAYGLIGMHATLQAALSLLDLGIGPALSRELARYSAEPTESHTARHLARTLELVYWAIALIIGISIVLAGNLIATRWVNAAEIPAGIVVRAISLMGLVAAVQWPMTLYISGLQGLQRQVLLNGILTVVATFRYAGAALVIAFVSPTITGFFLWQVVVSLGGSALLAVAFWRCMPAQGTPARIRWPLLRTIWRFAGGVTGIALLSFLLTQADRVVLSKLLPLSDFGYYSLAVLVSQSLALFSGPVVRAVFPRFSQLVAANETDALRTLYHRSAQAVAVGVIPAGLLLSVFSSEVLLLWTRSEVTASHAQHVVSLLVIGSIFLALQTVPYFLALANGWTSLNIRLGIATVIVAIPSLVVATRQFGPSGAAAVWILVNGGTMPVYLYFLHRRYLTSELGRWWRSDVFLPTIASLGPILIVRAFLPSGLQALALTACLGVTYIVSVFFAAFAAPDVRSVLRGLRPRTLGTSKRGFTADW